MMSEIMDKIPADVNAFLKEHSFLQLTEAGKVRCTLNGHELPCNLKELKIFTEGKKYKKLRTNSDFNYSQFEPHVVSSTKQPNHLFCKLTLRHINRIPEHVLRHVNGKRYQRALRRYKECEEQGVVFVPATLMQKKPRDRGGEDRGQNAKRGKEFWAPSSSDGEGSDSEDSLSDLYPSTMFTSKELEVGEMMIVDGTDVHADSEEEEEVPPMEVDKQMPQKRRKAQSGGFKKKFKSHKNKRNGIKKVTKAKN